MSLILIKKNCRGSILIFSIWVLSFLTIFAVYIGLNIRGRMSLMGRLEARNQMHYIGQAGIKKAIALLRKDLEKNNQVYTAESKQYRHNNTIDFSSIRLGGGRFEIAYKDVNIFTGEMENKFGIIDEERKLNINTASPLEMKRLFQIVLFIENEQAQEMAEAIFDWREFGKSQTTGFYSDDYYANLQYPYEPKNFDFEVMEELLLVKGITNINYKALLPFITIYGGGQVNINTVSREVLVALGLDDIVAGKLIDVRRGNDGIENTLDDLIFNKTFDIASTINTFIDLNEDEMRQIDALNKTGRITNNSHYYAIESIVLMDQQNLNLRIACIYNGHENLIEYWREKY